jgi:hypothetical protein
MGLEDQLRPGMSFVAVCRLFEGWACARVPAPSGALGPHDWDFTHRSTGQMIRATFEGGQLLRFTEIPSDEMQEKPGSL